MSRSPFAVLRKSRWRFEFSKPQLEHQQHPKHMIVIAAFSVMLIEKTV
jgi:hypothetical protein